MKLNFISRMIPTKYEKKGLSITRSRIGDDWVVRRGDNVIYIGTIEKCKKYIEQVTTPVY